MDAHNLSWVIHIRDIFWRPCTDDHYRTALDRFNSLRHPVIYSPGDNEWTDCWEPGSGSFAPRERLASLRRIVFADPQQSLGGRRIRLATQSDRPVFGEFVENVRRRSTIRLPGSWSFHAGSTGSIARHASMTSRPRLRAEFETPRPAADQGRHQRRAPPLPAPGRFRAAASFAAAASLE